MSQHWAIISHTHSPPRVHTVAPPQTTDWPQQHYVSTLGHHLTHPLTSTCPHSCSPTDYRQASTTLCLNIGPSSHTPTHLHVSTQLLPHRLQTGLNNTMSQHWAVISHTHSPPRVHTVAPPQTTDWSQQRYVSILGRHLTHPLTSTCPHSCSPRLLTGPDNTMSQHWAVTTHTHSPPCVHTVAPPQTKDWPQQHYVSTLGHHLSHPLTSTCPHICSPTDYRLASTTLCLNTGPSSHTPTHLHVSTQLLPHRLQTGLDNTMSQHWAIISHTHSPPRVHTVAPHRLQTGLNNTMSQHWAIISHTHSPPRVHTVAPPQTTDWPQQHYVSILSRHHSHHLTPTCPHSCSPTDYRLASTTLCLNTGPSSLTPTHLHVSTQLLPTDYRLASTTLCLNTGPSSHTPTHLHMSTQLLPQTTDWPQQHYVSTLGRHHSHPLTSMCPHSCSPTD